MSMSSASGSSYSNPTRIVGMASGLDTDALVKAMMQPKTHAIDVMKQKQQTLSWQRDQYRDMNTLFAGLQTSVSNIRYQYNFMKNKATTDNTSVTAAASSKAVAGSYTMVVKQLASAASMVGDSLGVASNQSQSLTSADMKLNITGTTGTTQVTINAGSTISDVVSAINGATASTGVVASYDSATDRLYLNGTTTGSTSTISLSGADTASQDFLNQTLKLPSGATTFPATVSTTGKDAIVDFNGVKDIHFQTNSFTLNNITFSLTQPPATTSVSASTGVTGAYDVNVTVGQDTDSIYNNIKSFVDSYNTLIDKVNTKLTEPRYRDYPPLTDDQKAAMKDSDITLWNQKAQSGLLQSDDTLQNAIFQMRTLVESTVNNATIQPGQYKMLSDIGISEAAPGSTGAYSENGKLYIDDAKLKAAIAANPQQVINLFTANGSETNMNQTGLDQGIAERLYRASTNVMSSLTGLAGSSSVQSDQSILGLQISDLGSQITDSTSKLSDYQQQYYNQFSKLESLMTQFDSQKSALSAMLSSGGA